MKTIPLTRGKQAIVDDIDYEYLSQFKWTAGEGIRKELPSAWYAYRQIIVNGKQVGITMHGAIMKRCGFGKHPAIDHKDLDGLNNRRENLRPCNKSQNGCNQRKRPNLSSRFKGVNWDNKNKKWRARIKHNQRTYFLGRFKTEENAATAYNFAADEKFGEFALFNSP